MTPYERRNSLHDRQGKLLRELLSFIIILPAGVFLATAMPAAIVGIDLWGIYEPSPVPGWWDWATSVVSLACL